MYASVELNVENNQGFTLKSVALGMPFSVSVITKDENDIRAWPQVEGLHKFHVIGQNSAMNVTSDGSKQTHERRFIYTVVADTAGAFTLGPVTISAKVYDKTSKDVTVLDAKMQKKERYPAPIYQLLLGKKRAIVGERIPFAVRFTYQDPDLHLTHVDMPRTAGVRLGSHDQGTAYVHEAQGAIVQTIEYKGYLYPELSDSLNTKKTITFSPLRADYAEKERQASWGPFFGFGVGMQKKAVYSQPVTLEIDPLPASKEPIQAVGIFTSFSATLASHEVAQGEAVVLTLTLSGDADFEKIKTPILKIPADLRSYESKQQQESERKKAWEYIVQGLKQGTYTIPEQLFTYFDLNSRTVKTLKTKPLNITITKPLQHMPVPEDEKRDAGKVMSEAAPQAVTAGHIFKNAEIPWLLFLILMLLPPLWHILPFLRRGITNVKGFRRVEKVLALREASYVLQKACKENKVSEISTIMRQAIVRYYGLDETIDDQNLMRALKNAGWGNAALQEWEENMRELASYSSYAPKLTRNELSTESKRDDRRVRDICKRAEQWLTRIRKGELA